MGRVWLGYDEVLHRDVAVKEVVPPPGLTAAEQDMSNERSLREARAIARLNHPNVVRIYDVVSKEPHPWIVMEYVPSRSLHQVIVEDGPLPPAEVARIGLGVLGALCAAHRAGIVHRDVKPSNVLLSGQRVVLTDWGLATMEGDVTVTRTGMIIGSPAYISPERARDGEYSPSSDLWSLGATLYAAVEGRAPYERSSAMATLTALATEEPDPPVHAGPLRPVLDGLLVKDPARRMGPFEAEQALRHAVGPPKPRQRPAPWRAPHPRPTEAEPSAEAQVPADAPHSPAPPAAVTEVTPSARNRSRLRHRIVVAALVLEVLLIVGLSVAFVFRLHGAPATRYGPTPAATGTVATTARAGSSGATTPGARTPGAALPAGWHYVTDPTGFTVAVPDGWTRSTRDGIVYYRDPAGGRLLGIDQTNQPKPDPVADWQTQKARRVPAGDFPGYQDIGIRPVAYHVKAADWEFTYNGRNGRLHVINRGAIFNDHQAYGFYWETPDSQWAANLPNFDLITRTFQGKR
jgi:eukaryotic-like serine/threonine-protein kinase